MKVTYNVLTEPWIQAVRKDGTTVFLGIRDVLLQAHELLSVTDASPLVEFGYYRLLSTFLMDALRPESIYDIKDLLAEGRFSEDVIDQYIQLCEEEGVSFNLFDEKRPFLQAAYNEALDGERKPSAYLDYTIPTGNNHVHFDHLTRNKPLSFAAALRQLAPIYLFATAGVKGYPSSINAAPPFFAVIKGKCLFEALVYLLVPTEELQFPLDTPPVFWRNNAEITPKASVATTSYLFGLLFPARRVLLIPNESEKTVSEIYYSQGLNFCQPDNWTDPSVAYYIGNSGRVPRRPNLERPVWLNLCDLIDVYGHLAPHCISLYQRINDSKPVDAKICLYGVATNKASYVGLAYHDFSIPLIVMQSQERIDVLRECIRVSEETAKTINSCLQCKAIPKGTELVQNCKKRFYNSGETAIWRLCKEDLSADRFDGNACIRNWKKTISEIGRTSVEETINGLNLQAAQFVQLQKNLSYWYYYLNQLRKEDDA